ncbi:Vacuolar protein sorting-associated protein 9a [Colletotrichum siamense]|uniref:Vacuolar protein sorting-associated protein 9a n=1 Tax=Colletotrichum siamense TaxID=690259 RepID=A0A9P5F2F7_COLSI|nr:Vacuolar protein sorting-associated protein 9a [Colletotrichum siamense]KAF4866139.1 Vacuolar protein sorting-associated protein 9a [Colletotrichum siamense]
MSPTDPTDNSSGLSGATQNDKTVPVTSAEPAGSKAETDLASLQNHNEDGKATMSAKAAGKQQATDDLIDFGDDSSAPAPAAPVVTDAENKTEGSAQTASAPAPGGTAETMTSSIATLKPTSPLPAETSTQFLTIEATSAPYVDPTPPTPRTSQPPSRTPSNAGQRRISSESSPTRSDAGYDERRYASEDEQEGSRSEIQSIMEQFTGDGGGPGEEEVMSPRLEIASPMLGTTLGSPGIQHPPRKSSLEPLVAPSLSHQVQELQGLRIHTASPSSILSRERPTDDQGPPVPPKDGPPATPARSHDDRQMSVDSQMSPGLHRPPPPEPEPEPALPFDFHRFLEQLRNKKADPVARYLKSFLSEFGKRQWMVHEQVKIISDFLAFIANKMAQCEVWRDVSDAEFDNAREGMEKLVMNRLYTQTFSPAIPPPQPIPGAKPKRRGGERPMGPGRRGQHQEDIERDDVLTQKIQIYAWLREEHLDIPPAGESGRRFLKLAQQELLKIKSYRAPRDKIICVLNCCKVIFGLLKHSKSDSSADSFMPLLIYVVLQANPEHLVSNVQYILRFRNQEKLGGEAGYYLSSLMGAIQFIENMDRTTLTITDEEFEKNVEAAVSAIAEKHRLDSPHPVQEPVFSEKSGFSFPPSEASTTRPSLDIAVGESSVPRRSTSSNEGTPDTDQAPISGLLRSIQKPLSTIGRMFSDEPSPPPAGPSNPPRAQGGPERLSPRPSMEVEGQRPSSRHQLSAEEAAARQASAEAAEAQRLHRAEHNNVVETLAGMFPDLDRDIISDVVYQKQGRVGLAVDACLALST